MNKYDVWKYITIFSEKRFHPNVLCLLFECHVLTRRQHQNENNLVRKKYNTERTFQGLDYTAIRAIRVMEFSSGG